MKTMRVILTAALLAALAVPAAVIAADPPGQDQMNAARACSELRERMGLTLFRQTYGTPASKFRNAFGKCVSKWTRTESQNRQSAQAACEAERNDPNFAATHGGKTFAQFYGTGKKGANAFGRCVSSKAKTASAEAQSDTVNAARWCKAERQRLGVPAFRALYGKNAEDRNAFGKCVSARAKAQNN